MNPSCLTWKKINRLITNDPRITPLPIILTAVFDKIFLAKPFTRKPAKGSNGTR
jgi:hypothetical protein